MRKQLLMWSISVAAVELRSSGSHRGFSYGFLCKANLVNAPVS
jgi:hypothetical protein